MKESEVILEQQSARLFFKNGDTDFFSNRLLEIDEMFGFSHGESYHFARRLGKSPKPSTWKKVFLSHTDYPARELGNPDSTKQGKTQYYLVQTYSTRSAIQLVSPFSEGYLPIVQWMGEPFRKAAYSLKAPIEELTTHYQGSYLPGCYLYNSDGCPALIMINDGDTHRGDLFYFTGYPGWKQGYNALTIDLSGQGSNPSRKLTFDMNATTLVSLCVDWLENKNPKLNHLVVYGASEGGCFIAWAVEQSTGIQTWAASTPVYSIIEIFKKEFGSSLKAPSWLMNAILKLAGNLDESAGLNLREYAWQSGTTDLKGVIDRVFRRARVVNYQGVQCLCLFIIGEKEGTGLQHQARVVYEAVKSKNSHTRLQILEMESGTDARCQVNNLRFVRNIVFDWLDTLPE